MYAIACCFSHAGRFCSKEIRGHYPASMAKKRSRNCSSPSRGNHSRWNAVDVMSLTRTSAIVIRHLYLLRSSPARLLGLLAWVAVDMVLWGFITKYLNSVTTPGFDLVPVLLGAVLFWDFFTRVMHGVTTAFFEDVWSHNFLNVFATPLSISEYVTGLVLSSIATSLIGLAFMVFLTSVIFGLSIVAYGPAVAAFLLVLFLFGVALGVCGSAVVLRLGPSAEWFIWPIPALISPFAGV